MKALRRPLLLAVLLSFPSPAAAQSMAAWEAPIAEASNRFGIPASWIRRVIQAESAGQTMRGGRPIRSRVGAMGLMQLMPGTWRLMRSAHGLGPDPDDPRDNILAGTAYLRAMYDRFGYPGLFAAYNAGPGRYAEHLARGRALPAETVAYVAKVAAPDPGPASDVLHLARRGHAPAERLVFGQSRDGAGLAEEGAGEEPRSRLFFPLRRAGR